MSGNEETPQDGGGDAAKKDDIFENQGTKKLIRLVTVMAYMFSVSFVAIVLSAYYIFLWEPPNPTLLRRPGPLSDPELDFLRSDPMEENEPFYHRHHKNHTSFLSARVIKDNFYPRFEFPVPIITEPDNLIKDHAEERKELNKSLSSLRNYLIEVLQHKAIESLNHTEKGNTGGKVRRHSSIIMNRLLNDNSSFQTLESPTISGGKANNDRLTISRHDSVYDSPPNILKKTESVDREKFGENQVVSSFKTESKTPWYLNVPDGEFINIAMRSDEGNVDTKGNKDRTSNVDNINNQPTTDSTYKMNYADRLKYSKQLKESRAKLNVAQNSKETQIEEMTTKLSLTNEHSPLPENTTSTYRPKDLLTILVQSVNANSSTLPITTFEDLQTDSSTEETSTKILTSDIN
ncbi:uncharacterized protein LOC108627061 [Ceratina calcarata]|uniref:Uncharacterized protein LOC108627061 n=1 Tax=Ceratina calcarata TaxID=156304 RepID=A0AAJ7N9I4_9HYME|nr:uncharacterized protein LOC108627061 [Ceratina calcarata]